jgi:hypothetical protein
MTGFWADVAANLIGTFVGAGLALLSSWEVNRRAVRRKSSRSLQSVIDRLSRSRAFTHLPIETNNLTADVREDRERCTVSILNTREHIARVTSELSDWEPAEAVLEDMHGACALYLRSVENYPQGYVAALVDLREVLWALERKLGAIDPRLKLKRPGENAFLR